MKMSYFETLAYDIKKASRQLGLMTEEQKNSALSAVAKALDEDRTYILKENAKDIELAKTNSMSNAMIDRLALNDRRIDDMLEGIKTVIRFQDPVGKSSKVWTTADGLRITKITVPIGVLAIIYEGRPNVTVDAFALALKSGNAIILRGSASAIRSNMALEKAILRGLEQALFPLNVLHLVKDNDRAIVKEILTANDLVDLAIPRGGADLINMVIKEATVPTLQTGEGNNHIYVDESADFDMALEIIKNAKLQRPSTCNAVEKLLVHQNIAERLLKKLYSLTSDRLSFHTDKRSANYIIDGQMIKEEEWKKEYLDYVLGVKIVDSIDEAIEHINAYTTSHSECIITNDLQNAIVFQRKVDAAAVYVNASTRFTDGGEFGFGMEMGISTQKMHARGPIGLDELVTSKYLVIGNGHIRK